MATASGGTSANRQKEELSIAYVHAVAARAGYACEPRRVDNDSVDVQIFARGQVGVNAIKISPQIDVQLKATSQPQLNAEQLAFSLPKKNYEDLRADTCVPRILVVFVLPSDSSQWLEQNEDQLIARRCAYWRSLFGSANNENKGSVTVHLPRKSLFNVDALRSMMERVSQGGRP